MRPARERALTQSASSSLPGSKLPVCAGIADAAHSAASCVRQQAPQPAHHLIERGAVLRPGSPAVPAGHERQQVGSRPTGQALQLTHPRDIECNTACCAAQGTSTQQRAVGVRKGKPQQHQPLPLLTASAARRRQAPPSRRCRGRAAPHGAAPPAAHPPQWWWPPVTQRQMRLTPGSYVVATARVFMHSYNAHCEHARARNVLMPGRAHLEGRHSVKGPGQAPGQQLVQHLRCKRGMDQDLETFPDGACCSITGCCCRCTSKR